MLYLIGLGLNEKGISQEGLEIVRKCKRIYLENYTVNFPYSEIQLKEVIGKKIIPAGRAFVESLKIVDEAKKLDVALLIYGAPLTATTHISLIQEAKESKIKYKVIYSGSIFDAIAETGLQVYKFGKITSMPKWKENYMPTSFMEVIKENQKINAHSLILIDINLKPEKAFEQLKKSVEQNKVNLKKIIVCSRLGTKDSRIFYEDLNELENKKIKAPYCIIIPGKLHFFEEDFLGD